VAMAIEAVVSQRTAVQIMQDMIEEKRREIDRILDEQAALLSKRYDGRNKTASTIRKHRSQINTAMARLLQRQHKAEAAYQALRRAFTELLPLIV
jgi:hypothetical protein